MTAPVKQRRTAPTAVADLLGGEYARVHAGLVRLTHTVRCGERWARLLNEDLTETDDHVYLAPNTRVLELIQPPEARQVSGGLEVDPLRAGAIRSER